MSGRSARSSTLVAQKHEFLAFLCGFPYRVRHGQGPDEEPVVAPTCLLVVGGSAASLCGKALPFRGEPPVSFLR
jgi:hypothetical protein